MPDPNVVAGVVARGARAAQSGSNEGPHGAGAFDVWTHTGEGLTEESGGTSLLIINMPASATESGTSVSAIPGAMAQQVGALKEAAAGIGQAKGALATVGAVMNTLTSLEQAISLPLSAIPFPAYPAIRVLDMDVGLPHAHNHPPNLIPPAPPVPLPSTGPVIPIPYVSGAATVLINGMPAGRCGDMGMGIFCGGFFPMFEIFLGSSSVWIEGMRAARLGVDITKHCVFSSPKPNDPPMGPMVGMTISASGNVIIGGVPMPSLTNMAVAAAMKVVFKGLVKLIRGVRNLARVASRASEEEAAAAARAAEREALIARTGEPSGTHTGGPLDPRPWEVPYRNPPEMYKIPPNPPASLDPTKTYLWAVDPEGNVLIAPERQDGFGRVVKHGDLTPGPEGATRGPARAGGELNYNPETGHWEMDNNSSYTFARTDGARGTADNLAAAHELMEQGGMDMSNIDCTNTHGAK